MSPAFPEPRHHPYQPSRAVALSRYPAPLQPALVLPHSPAGPIPKGFRAAAAGLLLVLEQTRRCGPSNWRAAALRWRGAGHPRGYRWVAEGVDVEDEQAAGGAHGGLDRASWPPVGCAAALRPPSPYRWTEFVTVRGHANPIPKQWGDAGGAVLRMSW